jgi:hypothetical protein
MHTVLDAFFVKERRRGLGTVSKARQKNDDYEKLFFQTQPSE